MCQIGCQVRSDDIGVILGHLAESHSFEELKSWSINRDLLLEENVNRKRTTTTPQPPQPIVKAYTGSTVNGIADSLSICIG